MNSTTAKVKTTYPRAKRSDIDALKTRIAVLSAVLVCQFLVLAFLAYLVAK